MHDELDWRLDGAQAVDRISVESGNREKEITMAVFPSRFDAYTNGFDSVAYTETALPLVRISFLKRGEENDRE